MIKHITTLMAAVATLATGNVASAYCDGGCPASSASLEVFQVTGLTPGRNGANSVRVGTYERTTWITIGGRRVPFTVQYPALCVNGELRVLKNFLENPVGYTPDSDVAICVADDDTTVRIQSHDGVWTCGDVELKPWRYNGYKLHLIGNGAPEGREGLWDDMIYGGAGDDVLCGEDGPDYLLDRGGNDRLDGGSGSDDLADYAGNDYLYGRSGSDELVDHAGTYDRLYAGSGDDVCIEDRDQRFVTLDCGAGSDSVTEDTPASAVSCENDDKLSCSTDPF